MTSSTRYLVEAGKISPETRLMAISKKPAARIPRRGLIRARTSGSSSQARFLFAGLVCAPVWFSAAMELCLLRSLLIAKGFAGLQSVGDALLGLALAAEAHEGFALEIEKVLFADQLRR